MDLCNLWNGALKGEHQLLLYAVSRWREVSEWHEEVRELPTPPQRILYEQQTLERYLPAKSILKPEMICSDIYSRSSSEIIISHLRDHRIRAFDGEDVHERHITTLRDSADL